MSNEIMPIEHAGQMNIERAAGSCLLLKVDLRSPPLCAA
jgi:hypothetical protein